MGHTRNKSELKKSFKEKKKEKSKARKKQLQLKRSKLIVKNLPFQVTEENLKKHFETFGKIASVQLLKRDDNKLVGCGFVQFEAVQKAAKAKHHLNGKPFLGRNIECDFAMPKKQYEQKVKQTKKLEIKKETEIKDEPIDIDEIKEEKESSDDEQLDTEEKPEKIEIKEDESSDSDIEEVKDENDSNSEESEEDSDDDDKDNDSGVDDIDEPPVKRPKVESHDIVEQKTVFVKNVPFDATNQDVKECMLQFGPVYYALVCKDKLTEHSKGTAFVKFREKEDADKCLAAGTELKIFDNILDCHPALDRNEINKRTKEKEANKHKDNRNLYLMKEGVIMAGSKAAEGVSASDMAKRLQLEQSKSLKLRNLNVFISTHRLVIHNLPNQWDDSKLRELCKKHAGPGCAIKESRIMRNLKALDAKGVGASKEYGFVSFTTHEHALNALRSLNNNPNVFSVAKRPIVGFSLEDRKMVNAKQKRMVNSMKLNPTSKQFDPKMKEISEKHKSEKHKSEKHKSEKHKSEKLTEVAEGGEFSGLAAKPGQPIQKLRSRNKLRAQAQIHQEQLKVEKSKRKNAPKTLEKKKEGFIRQEAQKVNKQKKKTKEKIQDDNFTKMVNSYKMKLLNANTDKSSGKSDSAKKWYEQ